MGSRLWGRTPPSPPSPPARRAPPRRTPPPFLLSAASLRLASDLARPSPSLALGNLSEPSGGCPRAKADVRLPAAVVRLTALALSESGSYGLAHLRNLEGSIRMNPQ